MGYWANCAVADSNLPLNEIRNKSAIFGVSGSLPTLPLKVSTMKDDAPKQAAYDKHNEDPGHLEQRIRKLAYRLWEVEGRLEGRDDEYWNRAQELLQDETKSAYPPSASRGNRT
jgi:hypothetical protein